MFCQVIAGTAVEQQHVLSHSGGRINPLWVLLDNQSTVDVFLNIRLLKNIRKSDRSLTIFSTRGLTTTDLQGDLPGYGTVLFHPGGIANILSLSKVSENAGCPTTAPGETSSSFTCQEGKSDLLHNARGVYSTPTWLQGRRCLSIL